MRKITKLYFLFFISLTLINCSKEEVLRGDIIGNVKVFNECYYELEDKSNVNVTLTGENLMHQTVTDINGNYAFDNIPYGYYQIEFLKGGYYRTYSDNEIHHVGGKAPTYIDQIMNKIPEYDVIVDSVKYYIDPDLSWMTSIHLFVSISESCVNIGWPILYFHSFYSSSPNVSSNNFDNSLVFYYERVNENSYVYAGEWLWQAEEYDFLIQYSDTIHMCIYPQPWSDEIVPWNAVAVHSPPMVKPEILGNKSNVVSFTLDQILAEEPPWVY